VTPGVTLPKFPPVMVMVGWFIDKLAVTEVMTGAAVAALAGAAPKPYMYRLPSIARQTETLLASACAGTRAGFLIALCCIELSSNQIFGNGRKSG
jgi:hypothetical protein